jgi:zinc protease
VRTTHRIALALFVAGALPLQAQSFDRTTPPALGPAPALSVPRAVERTLPNGLRLIIVEQHELPLVDISLVIRSGGEADPTGKTGVATLTASLLTDGAGARDAQAIAEQQAFLGVQVGAYSGWDQSAVALHAPVAVLDSALALFADIALRPTFPAAEYDRARQQRLTELLQTKDRGPSIADRAFAAILYGEDHPYGRPLAGIESTIESLTRDDVQSFYRTFYRPNNAFLLVVGDVQPADIERRVRALFGGWTQGTIPTTTARITPSRRERRIYVVDKPDAAQSSFRIGAVGVPRSTDDYYALQVMNTVLGGAFTSRLNNNLRETKGYTYGAGSGFSMRREAGPFAARAEIVAAKSDSALIEFLRELDAIRQPIPTAELEKAKQYLQLGLPGGFETTSDIASQLSALALYGLPLTEPAQAVGKIGAVNTGDVQRVAAKYIDPATLAIVISGDAKTLLPALRALNVGPVEVRDSYGRPVIVP